MAIALTVVRSTPHSLVYRAMYSSAAPTDLIVEAAGAASPDLLTDSTGELNEMLQQPVTSVNDASIVMTGGSTAAPITNPNIAGGGFTRVGELLVRNDLIVGGAANVTWGVGPAWNNATNRIRLYIQVFVNPNTFAQCNIELRVRHSMVLG